MSEKLNIFQKMLKITSELKTVAKNLTVETSKNSSYKAVSERDVLDAVKPLEEKYGVYSYPVARKVIQSDTYDTETKYGVKTVFMSRIETVYRFVDVDNPEDYIETVTFAEGIDSQDKGSGKAMTYSDKYALMKAYKISTGEDPDQNGSKDERYLKKGEPKMSSRDKLISYLYQNGMDIEAYSKEHNLNKTTPAEVFDVLLQQLIEADKVDTSKGFSSIPGGTV